MVHLIVVWFVSALALWIVSQVIPGIRVRDFGSALIAAAVIAVVDAVLGPVFRFFAWPFVVVTLGLFSFVVNALLLKLASVFTPGFEVHGFFSAVIGSIVLTLLNSVLRHLVFSPRPSWTSF